LRHRLHRLQGRRVPIPLRRCRRCHRRRGLAAAFRRPSRSRHLVVLRLPRPEELPRIHKAADVDPDNRARRRSVPRLDDQPRRHRRNHPLELSPDLVKYCRGSGD
ncbi:unnamed protein product, partial [Linum tenue]